MRQDLRYALRLLHRRPAVAALIVSTLAIGIAATTIVFSLADAILWHPVPFRNADRLVRVRVNFVAVRPSSTSPLDFGTSLFDGVYPFQLNSAIVKVGNEPRAVTVGEISQGLLQTLGAAPIWGREFARAEFVADGFEFPVSRVALWRPYVPEATAMRMTALGRLKPGVTIGQAQAFAQATRDTRGSSFSEIRIAPFVAVVPSTAAALRVLLGAVGLLLLIAVANAANIIQAETVRRDIELAVRASLGASWPRLVRQLMAETLLVSVIAAIVAIIVSTWTLAALVKGVPYVMSFQALRPIGMDWRALLFATAIAIVAGIGASWLSAVRAMRIDPQLALRGQGSGVAGQARARAILTAAQIAVTLVLLTGAGLLGHGFLRLSRADPGFDPDHLVDLEVQLPTWRYAGELQMRAALERLRAETMRLPDIVGVTISHSMPPNLESRPLDGLVTEDTTLPSSTGFVSRGVVDDRFFATLGIPLLAGRAFDDRDQRNSPPVAVVSRGFAERLWRGREPLGKRFRESASAPWYTIVGVVGDVKNGGFDQALGPLAYYTARSQSSTWWYEGLIVRTRSTPEHTVPALRSVIQRALPDAPIVGVETGYDTIAGANARVRFATLLMITFAGIALAVALIGVYGMFWCTVSQRTREIGVRMALGATAPDVLRMVLAGSARLLAIGLAVGLALSLAATQVLKSLLFEVSPNDPTTFAAVIAFLATTAIAATYVPARRAAAVDPVQALRTQ